ncbi:hypothetical protein GGS20DRAFT_582579 [Poronia punctata]|nr:hypothetical protein GGS20DRAFT_582579 [Poronia punctata]
MTALLVASACANDVNAEPGETVPEIKTTATATKTIAPRETPVNILNAVYQLARNFELGACIPGALPLVTTLPKVPKDIIAGDAVNQALSQTTRELSEVCSFSITGPAGDSFTSFLPTWYSWYDKYSDRLQSIITKCPKASELVSTVEAYTTCSQVQAQLTAVPSPTTTSAGGDGGDDGPSPTETAPSESETSSAARETGFLGAAAAAAAGLLGVVAMI